MAYMRPSTDNVRQSAPVVELDPSSEFVLIQLASVACWPKDERRRGESLVTWAAQFLACLEIGGFHAAGMENLLSVYGEKAATQRGVSLDEILSMPHAKEVAAQIRALPAVLNTMIMSQIFVPGGGWASMANAAYHGRVGDRIGAANRGGAVAGLIVLYCSIIQECHPEITPSYNRASHIVQYLHDQRRIVVGGDRERKKAWREWRGVGHVWAALLIGMAVDEAQPVGHPSGLGVDPSTIVAWAQWFRDFATTHRAVGATSPLVPPHEAVVIQCGTDAIKPPLTPLCEDIRRAAFGYRAPLPAQ